MLEVKHREAVAYRRIFEWPVILRDACVSIALDLSPLWFGAERRCGRAPAVVRMGASQAVRPARLRRRPKRRQVARTP